MSEPTKCIVFGCTNRQGEGSFHSSGMCMPCFRMIITGDVGPSNNFIRALKVDLDESQKALNDAIDYANGRESEWGDRAECAFGILRKALKS